MNLLKSHILPILLISIFCLTPTSLFSQELNQNPSLIKGQLDNGLTYYIYQNPTPKGEAVYRLFIKSGSVYENDTQKGLAHFLEHMAFNGTTHFPGNTMVRFLESKGAKFGKDLNAHTSYNETVYKLQLPSSDALVVDTTMTILADWAGGLLLDSLEIESERGVIMSEWLSKAGPEKEAQNALLNTLLNNSRYADRLVIGDTAIIKNFPHRELRDYYEKWYDPSLMAVAVVGDVNAEDVKRMIYEKFGALTSRAGKPETLPTYPIEPYTSMNVKKVIHESLNKVELVGIQILPKLQGVSTEEEYLPYLERAILKRLFSARMSALSFGATSYGKANIGISGFLNTTSVLLISSELTPNKINEGINSFTTDIEQIYRYGFIPLEIEKEKKSYLASLKRQADSKTPQQSASLMNEIYSDFYSGNMIITAMDEYLLAEKYISRIDSLSLVKYLHQTTDWNKTHFILSAFDKVADKLPSDDKLMSTFGNLSKKSIEPYSKDMEIPEKLLTENPKVGKIVDEKYIPEIDAYQLKLSNGANVIFKPSDIDKNKILLSGFRKGGYYALDSTEYVNGLFAANIIALSGAGDFSRDALSYYLTGNTASMRFIVAKTRSGISGTANDADLETLFQLLYLKWTQPKVDNSVFEQVKEKSIESYQSANNKPSELFSRDLSYILQGVNYTNRELTDSIINNELKEDKLIGLYNNFFGGAEGFTFVIIGDYSKAEIEPYIVQYLAALPKGTPDIEYRFERKVVDCGNTSFVRHTGESPRAIVNLVFQQYNAIGSPEAENLRNSILSAIVKMKLLKSLREELGMVYSVGVLANSSIHPSPLSRQTISFSTAPENVDKLIERTHAELQMMVDNPDSFESELNDVKANLIKEMKLDVQKNSFWSSYIRNTIFNKEKNWTYVSAYDKTINEIGTKEIAEIIKEKLLDKQSMVRAILYPMKNDEKEKDNY